MIALLLCPVNTTGHLEQDPVNGNT